MVTAESSDKPMKDFMSKFMWKNRDVSEESLAQSERIFQQTCAQLVDSLGERPFHIRSGLNAAVSDSVMVAFSQNLDQVPADIKSRYKQLLDDEGFQNSISKRTT